MPKSDTMLSIPCNIVVDSTIKRSIVVINGNIGIFSNETLTLNKFCIENPNHIFLWCSRTLLELLIRICKNNIIGIIETILIKLTSAFITNYLTRAQIYQR